MNDDKLFPVKPPWSIRIDKSHNRKPNKSIRTLYELYTHAAVSSVRLDVYNFSTDPKWRLSCNQGSNDLKMWKHNSITLFSFIFILNMRQVSISWHYVYWGRIFVTVGHEFVQCGARSFTFKNISHSIMVIWIVFYITCFIINLLSVV